VAVNPASEPVTPDEFGPYEVYERLGIGGMAQVHRAKKRGPAGFERSVALKRMLTHLAEDRSFVESFIREAKVVSMLVHPNIAQVYDFGRIAGIYYIAMELVAGFDLRKLLRYANRANEPIPLAVVLSILGEMCDALEYAHTCKDEDGQHLNIVHRDISPSNMIIAHTGHLKIIDFGIAKASSRQLHTESGQVKGKLGYMSPESALGMSSGAVSDVFSMGVVAWELVTASPLFSARTDFETMRKIREAEVAAPSRHNPTCPPELDRLVLAALERTTDRRLPSAGAFRKGLDQIAARYGVQVSARSVAEWILQFAQPDDYVGASSRTSGRTPPPEGATAILRPSAKDRLQRSNDEIALATEIWGEDAQTLGPPPGPDFSSAEGAVPTLSGLALPGAADVRFSASTAPGVSDLQLTAPGRPGGGTPRHRQPAEYASFPLPPPPQSQPGAGASGTPQGYLPPQPQPAPRKKVGFLALAVCAFISAALGGVLILKSMRGKPEAPVSGPGSQVAMTASDAAVEHTAAVTPTVTPIVTPIVTPDAATETGSDEVAADPPDTHPTAGHPTRPKHHGAAPKHEHVVATAPPIDAAVAEPPPPEVKPDAAAQVAVTKPDPNPIVPEPPKPTRTPVVLEATLTKTSGEVPTLRGDVAGDVAVKICIDGTGAVSSVKAVNPAVQPPADLTRALQRWRYQPFKNKEGTPSAACFVKAFHIEANSGD
jgi:serine/threonine protein kinase